MAHSNAYIIMSRKSHMLRFARAHGIKIPPSFLTLWPHFGAASVQVLKEIQVKIHDRPTGIWDARCQKALFPPTPTPATPASLALWCHYHGYCSVYTQDLTLRWWGIIHQIKAWGNPRCADCSSFFKWLYYACNWPDPNGNGYALSGNTDSMMVKGERVDAPAGNDAVFYALPGHDTPEHMAIYVGDGDVVSHGVPGPPQLLPVAEMANLHIIQYRRYSL